MSIVAIFIIIIVILEINAAERRSITKSNFPKTYFIWIVKISFQFVVIFN